jgi:hypothetical protein
MAAAINELEIPSFNIPDLFMPQKLGVVPSPKQSNLALAAVPAAIATPPPCADDGNIVPTPDVHDIGLEALPFASVEPEVIVPKQHVSPPSYSSAVQAPPKRATTPELDYSGSTASESDESEDNLRQSPTISKSKLNPNVVSQAKFVLIAADRNDLEYIKIASFEACVGCLDSQLDLTELLTDKPPPCTLFYLSNCKHGAECKYGHDYLLEPEHYNEIRQSAKKSPCPSRNKGEAWTRR